MAEPMLHLVYLRSGRLVITKKAYANWREIQDEYEEYMTNLGPMSLAELAEFVGGEGYINSPQQLADLRAFAVSEAETLVWD